MTSAQRRYTMTGMVGGHRSMTAMAWKTANYPRVAEPSQTAMVGTTAIPAMVGMTAMKDGTMIRDTEG
jgi:hypothetical protein